MESQFPCEVFTDLICHLHDIIFCEVKSWQQVNVLLVYQCLILLTVANQVFKIPTFLFFY
jgi:hypothetical protein